MGSGQFLWTFTGRNKTLPPSTSLPVIGEIAGVNTASRDIFIVRRKGRWVKVFHDELNGHEFDRERDGLRQVVLCPLLTI